MKLRCISPVLGEVDLHVLLIAVAIGSLTACATRPHASIGGELCGMPVIAASLAALVSVVSLLLFAPVDRRLAEVLIWFFANWLTCCLAIGVVWTVRILIVWVFF